MCLIFFFFIHRPRFVLYNVITRTQCPLSYLSFILSYVQLMVPTPRLLLSCSVVLFCLTLGYSLLFLGVGGSTCPLSPVAVTLGALGLCFIVLIFKNKSVVCVICFPVCFPFSFSTHDTRLVLINMILKFFDVNFKYHLHEICILRFFSRGGFFLFFGLGGFFWS